MAKERKTEADANKVTADEFQAAADHARSESAALQTDLNTLRGEFAELEALAKQRETEAEASKAAASSY